MEFFDKFFIQTFDSEAGSVGNLHEPVFKFYRGIYEIKPFGMIYGVEFNC